MTISCGNAIVYGGSCAGTAVCAKVSTAGQVTFDHIEIFRDGMNDCFFNFTTEYEVYWDKYVEVRPNFVYLWNVPPYLKTSDAFSLEGGPMEPA